MKILKIGTLCRFRRSLLITTPLVVVKERRYLPMGQILYKVYKLEDGLEMQAYRNELEIIK
tara:strand:- start:1440 stop:1622 length:183 start_codon:yes stop_codon:yes gene_type:complete